MQSLPGGDIKLLCDIVVECVRELTGYDRVMVYKFHEDEHGEVVAENKRADLEPYMGLHYPATDIPQASRFLFRQNRGKMKSKGSKGKRAQAPISSSNVLNVSEAECDDVGMDSSSGEEMEIENDASTSKVL
ncbi:unnamed protein product [Linum tenue]|uniref:Phytochrome chromophore attachment site domain-containing protein n=1 Tax=Linum tenue TaxID=586396 RepID=A0AAV0MEA9_9ROSI|nr:unnamed protein product [Linum tenue]